MLEIKLYKSSWQAIKLILLTSPFAIIWYYVIITHSNIVPISLAWFFLCFCSLGIPLGIFNLLDARPQIIINETGIFDRTAYKDFINWNLINEAYLREINKQNFICLVLNKDVSNLLKVNKISNNISKSFGFQEVNIYLGQLRKIDNEKFVEFIKAMAHADASTKKILLTSTLYTINHEQPH